MQVPAPLEYERATSVGHAIALLERRGDHARILAGGHSLIPMMKLRMAEPAHLVDLQSVAELKGITVAGDQDGNLYHLDLGYSDGAWAYDPVGTLSSYTASTRTLTFGSAAFSGTADELKGLPILILPQSGPPYEYGKCASSTTTASW